ncbi:isoprenoid biosynthesis glyoxalase ElbB [Candidatus Regiella insecticola]|uniref:Glyoxalase n=1 Tax=Candidatus Regiella insecticola TaxID=138073 RepID=A0A6L2ZLQ3_9ENTR|nr:isoprenoid biosynthesis glyoxalase ElbB [Candidatus Regiella insecticola]GFN45354.1 glyoxalase [Candidatus Regiella insecticola]
MDTDKKVAVILSGCGVYDGAEINEVVLTLLSLEENKIQYQCFAPDIEQYHVVNHCTGNEVTERRNVLVESARIVRGKIKPLSKYEASEFAAMIVPGGFGVAKNFSDFAFKGANVKVEKGFLAICEAFKNSKKPVGFMCIAPVLLSKIYGKGVVLTVGNDKDTIAAISTMGGEHKVSTVNEIVFDEKNKIVTTPAYMLATSIFEAKKGIDMLIKKIIEIM